MYMVKGRVCVKGTKAGENLCHQKNFPERRSDLEMRTSSGRSSEGGVGGVFPSATGTGTRSRSKRHLLPSSCIYRRKVQKHRQVRRKCCCCLSSPSLPSFLLPSRRSPSFSKLKREPCLSQTDTETNAHLFTHDMVGQRKAVGQAKAVGAGSGGWVAGVHSIPCHGAPHGVPPPLSSLRNFISQEMPVMEGGYVGACHAFGGGKKGGGGVGSVRRLGLFQK